MIDCPVCKTKMKVGFMNCNGCSLKVEGQFSFPRLLRMRDEHIRLAEAFLLFGGNLKELAEHLGISYPTLRKRVDEMVHELKLLKTEDEKTAIRILEEVEQGKITAQEGMRRIKEMNGEL